MLSMLLLLLLLLLMLSFFSHYTYSTAKSMKRAAPPWHRRRSILYVPPLPIKTLQCFQSSYPGSLNSRILNPSKKKVEEPCRDRKYVSWASLVTRTVSTKPIISRTTGSYSGVSTRHVRNHLVLFSAPILLRFQLKPFTG